MDAGRERRLQSEDAPEGMQLPNMIDVDWGELGDSKWEIELQLRSEAIKRPLAEEADCTDDACKALVELGYAGLADEEGAADPAGPPGDAREAWRRRLEREGKVEQDSGGLGQLMRERAEADDPESGSTGSDPTGAQS